MRFIGSSATESPDARRITYFGLWDRQGEKTGGGARIATRAYKAFLAVTIACLPFTAPMADLL